MDEVLSVEKSLTKIISISEIFWFWIDFIALETVFWQLCRVIIALTFGFSENLRDWLLIIIPFKHLSKKLFALSNDSFNGGNFSSKYISSLVGLCFLFFLGLYFKISHMILMLKYI